MKLLLDTHALAWWFENSDRLGLQAEKAIASSETVVMVSVVSAFEMTLKHRLGKWPGIEHLLLRFDDFLVHSGFDVLALSMEHAKLAGTMAIDHRDPFDRLLIAQARIEDAVLVSNEKLFDRFGVRRLW